MLANALILLPDFALILLGLVLRRFFGYSDEFWMHLERMVYYIFFPAMLFKAVVSSRLDIVPASDMILVGLGFSATGMLLGLGAKWLLRPDGKAFASSVQCAFRFNTYVGFAVISGVAGSTGLATFALLVGFMIPLANGMAVWFLARHSGNSIVRELLRNPLIVATLAGLAGKALGLELPQGLERIGGLFTSAAIALGLMTVGAGLRLGRLRESLALINYMTLVKLVGVPLAALGFGALLGLSGVYLQAALVLAALPTASSAYILATRMGGDGQLVASIITMNVLVGMVTVPVWLSLVL